MNPAGKDFGARGDGAGQEGEFICSDGKTRLPYRVCGESNPSGSKVSSCNFVVVHDFFDNVDKTEVLFKSITRRHRGCRVLAFSYPGQSGTVFDVPTSMATGAARHAGTGTEGPDRREGATKPVDVDGSTAATAEQRGCVLNNTFIAPRLHELLQHVNSIGGMKLANPFHLVSSLLCLGVDVRDVLPVHSTKNSASWACEQ